MTIEQIRARVIASLWQALAQSGVDISTIPQDQQDKLVSKMADSLLVTVNGILDDIPKAEPVEVEPAEPTDEFGEKLLWKGRPFLSLVETYLVTSERVKIVKGLLSRDVENFELIRVQDIDLSQNMAERMMGIGDIFIRGSDQSNPGIVLRNISKPEEVYEVLRRAWLEARKRHGLQFREFM